jgi:hypothetical protein
MPLCPQITNTPITVTQTADFTVSSVVPLIADSTDGLANNIESIEILADGKTKVYRANDEPTGAGINNGDLWIDINDGNKLYVRTGGVWVTAQDGAIGTAQAAADAAAAAAAAAQAEADAAAAAAAAAQATANSAAAAAGAAQADATEALADAVTAYTAAIGSLQPSANTIVNAQNQMTAINGTGITVFSGASSTTGSRIVLNSLGLAAYGPGNSFSITNAVGNGTTVTYTASGHTFVVGSTVTVSDLAPAGYNGTFLITAIVAGSTFTVSNTTTATVTDSNGIAYGPGRSVNITNAVGNGSTVTYTASGHGYSVGTSVTISGLAPDGYNGTFLITSVVAGSTFTVSNGTTATLTDSSGVAQTATLAISATTGNAVFQGSITGSTIIGGTLNIAGKAIIDSTGLLTATGATIQGTVNAEAGYFGTPTNGFSINSTGMVGVGNGVISGGTISGTTFTNGSTFSVTSAGVLTATSGTIGGTTMTSTTLTGGTIQTSSGSSAVILNGASNALQFKAGGNVVCNMLNFSSSGALWHYGSTPDSTGASYPFVKISSSLASLDASSSQSISAGANGNLVVGQTTYSGGTHTFSNTLTANSSLNANSGVTVAGAPIYTGDATTTASTQTEGISLTQGGTVSARRSNNNPLNLHIFDVTAGTGTSVPVIQFIRNGTNRGTLEVFGNTTAPTLVGSSDYRLKENIRDYTESLDKLLATKVRVFNEVEDADHNDVIGFVAHEFAEVFPNMVNGEKDAVDIEGNPIYQKLGYTNLIPHLVGAIQALHKEVQTLKGE